MKKSVWDTKIPGLSGLLLLGIGIIVAYFLMRNTAIFTGRAAPDNTPVNIRVSNISDTSFTITYTTTDQVLGSINYGTSPNGTSVAMDDRDQKDGTPKPYYTHHITIKNLAPNTMYYYSILSGDEAFFANDSPSVTTAQPISQASPNQIPLTGSVTLPDGSAAGDSIVYAEGPNTQVVSTITDSSGKYTIPFTALRSKDLTSYATLTDETTLKLSVVAQLGSADSTIIATQINPVPNITLTNTYDFSIAAEPASPSAEIDGEGLPETGEATQSTAQVRIVSPEEGEGFQDPRPLFRGTAFPNKNVDIVVDTDESIQTTVNANANGNWTYRPPNSIPPGEYTLTISSRDNTDILQTVKRNFAIFTEGSNFTEPSISPVRATPTPTPSPTRIPTRTPTPLVTQIASPSPTPSPTEIVSITVSPTAQPSPVPSIPPTGSISYIITGVAAVATFGVGILLLILL